MPASKDRSVTEPNLAKGSATLRLCVDKGPELSQTANAFRYVAGLSKNAIASASAHEV
jgi:hypothetical protein